MQGSSDFKFLLLLTHHVDAPTRHPGRKMVEIQGFSVREQFIMTRVAVALCIGSLILFTAHIQLAQRATPVRTSAAAATTTMQPEAQTAMVQQYCAGCHNNTVKSGGLVLAGY